MFSQLGDLLACCSNPKFLFPSQYCIYSTQNLIERPSLGANNCVSTIYVCFLFLGIVHEHIFMLFTINFL